MGYGVKPRPALLPSAETSEDEEQVFSICLLSWNNEERGISSAWQQGSSLCLQEGVGLALPNLEVIGLLEKVVGRCLLLHIKVSNLSL